MLAAKRLSHGLRHFQLLRARLVVRAEAAGHGAFGTEDVTEDGHERITTKQPE